MLKNYLTIAFRNLRRHPGYASINVVSLAIGAACCILIVLFVQDDWSYDAFHEEADRIYRVNMAMRGDDGGHDLGGVTPMPLGPVLIRELPGVEHMSRVWHWSQVVRREDKIFEEQLTFVDPAFLQIFSFPLHPGPPARALSTPDAVVVTRAIAQKYFGSEDPVGKSLSIQLGEQARDVTVTGVVERIPSNTNYLG